MLLGAALMATTSVAAQKKTNKATVNWGPDLTEKENGSFDEVVGDNGTSTFLLVDRKKGKFIQRMDGLKMAWEKPLELKMDKKDMRLERIMLTDAEIHVFTSLYDKKQNENRLYVSSYDQQGFAPGRQFQLLATMHAEKQSNAGTFFMQLSPGKGKILVNATPPYDKKSTERTTMHMFSSDLQLLWSQEFKLPYTDEEFKMESWRVDDDGAVVLLGVKYASKQERRELKRANQATYEYHLLVYDGASAQPSDNLISVPDKFLQDMTISMGATGDILCGGLYGNKGSFSVRGAYYLRLDRNSKQVVHASYKEFSDDFITSYMEEKAAAKAKKKADKKGEELELPEFQLNDIILRDDGGAVLLAEQYIVREVTTTYTSNGQTYTTTSTHYYYNDLLVINIDPSGDIQWAIKIPKRQHSVNDQGRFSGVAVNVKHDKIYFVFNDTGENLFLKPGDKVKQFALTGKDALVVLATVDANGTVSREALFSPDRRDVILRPKDCVELEDESMFIYANRKKDYRYGLITFK